MILEQLAFVSFALFKMKLHVQVWFYWKIFQLSKIFNEKYSHSIASAYLSILSIFVCSCQDFGKLIQ